MAHTQKTAAERAAQIVVSQGGTHADKQFEETVTPLKNKPALKDGK